VLRLTFIVPRLDQPAPFISRQEQTMAKKKDLPAKKDVKGGKGSYKNL
jgi:hypothetical protein